MEQLPAQRPRARGAGAVIHRDLAALAVVEEERRRPARGRLREPPAERIIRVPRHLGAVDAGGEDAPGALGVVRVAPCPVAGQIALGVPGQRRRPGAGRLIQRVRRAVDDGPRRPRAGEERGDGLPARRVRRDPPVRVIPVTRLNQ